MRRHAYRFAVLASAVMLIVTIATWIRSYRWTQVWAIAPIRYGTGTLHHDDLAAVGCIGWSSGWVLLCYNHVDARASGQFMNRWVDGLTTQWRVDFSDRNAVAEHFGGTRGSHIDIPGASYFRYEEPRSSQSAVASVVPHWLALRHWLLAIVFVLLPAHYAWHAGVRRHRRRAGLCLACGYDLRSSSNQCPECGQQQTQVKGPGRFIGLRRSPALRIRKS
jgi:hypothetical protein